MRIAVMGAGSWGTALAQVACANGHEVRLWARRDEVARAINRDRRNPGYLRDVELGAGIEATSDLAHALDGAEALLVVTPSKVMRAMAREVAPLVRPDLPVALCFKGIEEGTGRLPAEVFAAELGSPERIAVLSGPNHAEEVAIGIPAATVIACASAHVASFLQDALGSGAFRVYASDDVPGVELCAASKNVIAIAVGASYGSGCGDNTAAMLITRGMAEMSRLVSKAGGDPLTCMGLAGAGDLIATCMSQHSRNRRFGERLVEGMTPDRFSAETGMVVEGALAARNFEVLERRYGVDLPITRVVRDLVWGDATIAGVRRQLLERSFKAEFYGL
ncbi:NAD(P)-dependent glycerol-3-phosphate dehydrogenase [Berryella wangjianweii]|uniref:Glycerol-3-phosphate dehydrogenase [NAD(P)+] n=1 Tax=Berryella wangjianweii TaxID=2734634 RepID=A0A6M8J780_9ACTN|nr:NAD(P)H-dependent glycerol-3-phosphate dehydrogenase [Berryella wangjianweii]NPD32460.1 NAD(P)-dependent glycerol-3-phosphate dehydrogenase [Eggerthellaceae bacterium zg-997]QKF06782.1 NAD(P)-dependent glycerol-3-phosphate dehydrogenase [Berryella wangjianweii]